MPQTGADGAECGGPPVSFAKRADGGGVLVEFTKTDGDVITTTICNEGGLALAQTQSQDVEIGAIIAAVVEQLDAPAMIAKAPELVRDELGLRDVSPEQIAQVYLDALDEADAA